MKPRPAQMAATWPNFGRCGSPSIRPIALTSWNGLSWTPSRQRARSAEGHRVVDRYEMEKRLPLVRCPTLVIAPTADPYACPHAPKVAAAIAGSLLIEIENGMVPLPDQMPGEFAAAVHGFLAAQPTWAQGGV